MARKSTLDDEAPKEVEGSFVQVRVRRVSGTITMAKVLEQEDAAPTKPVKLNFRRLSSNWMQLCLGLFEAFPMFGSVAKMIHLESAENSVGAFLDRVSEDREEVEESDAKTKTTTYRVKRQHSHEVFGMIATLNQYKRAEKAIVRGQLLALVAEYEAFVGELLKLTIGIRPAAFISKDSNVSVIEVINASDVSALRESIIEDKIEQMQRESHIEQIFTIYDKLKLARPDEVSIREFAEICERRNVLTHANGCVNKIYISKLKALGFKSEALDPLGSELRIDLKYMRRSIARVFIMGYFTLHIVWQHLLPEENDDSVKTLINDAHEFLNAGYTKMADRICHFILAKKSPACELDRAYAIVNLALSYYLNEEIERGARMEKVETALRMRDWSIVDSKFALALCCLREEYEKLGHLIDAAVADGLTSDEFLTWALFSNARKQDIFRDKMLHHFNIELDPEVTQRPKRRKFKSDKVSVQPDPKVH